MDIILIRKWNTVNHWFIALSLYYHTTAKSAQSWSKYLRFLTLFSQHRTKKYSLLKITGAFDKIPEPQLPINHICLIIQQSRWPVFPHLDLVALKRYVFQVNPKLKFLYLKVKKWMKGLFIIGSFMSSSNPEIHVL